MEDKLFHAVFMFNDKDGITELRIPANNIEQRSGWVLALYNEKVIGGVKEEYLKAFCLEPDTNDNEATVNTRSTFKNCQDCGSYGWDMPQCRECDASNNFKYFERKYNDND